MPADNWRTIWQSRMSKIKRGCNTYFVVRFYLKEHKNKQRRLVLWLRDVKRNLSFYGNISLWDFIVDLKRIISKTKRRVRKK